MQRLHDKVDISTSVLAGLKSGIVEHDHRLQQDMEQKVGLCMCSWFTPACTQCIAYALLHFCVVCSTAPTSTDSNILTHTHSINHSINHSITHSLTHSLTHSFTHSLTSHAYVTHSLLSLMPHTAIT